MAAVAYLETVHLRYSGPHLYSTSTWGYLFVACHADQVGSARTGLLQRLEIELPPENGLEIEPHSESCLVEPAVLVGCAAAEPRSLGSCSAQDSVRKAADVASSVAACEIGQYSCLVYWYSQGRRVVLPPATSIRPPVAPGNDPGSPKRA